MKRMFLCLPVVAMFLVGLMGCSAKREWNHEQRKAMRQALKEYRNMVYLNDLTDAEKIATIKALYEELGVPERVEQQIAQKFQKALSILDTLEVPQERTAELRKYAENLIGRKS